MEAPWWLNLVFAIVAFVLLRWFIPAQMTGKPILAGFSAMFHTIAPWAGLFFLFAAAVSFIRERKSALGTDHPSSRRSSATSSHHKITGLEQDYYPIFKDVSSGVAKVIDEPKRPSEWTLELLRQLEWKRFEELCAAYFHELGLRAETIRCGADGGIDAKLFKGDSNEPESIIQCKAWNTRPVGVKPVRELFGVMAHEKVAKGIFLTTGSYTQEARSFAQEKSLFLVDGEKLLGMIKKLTEEARQRLLILATKGDYTTPTCPSCGVKMVKRSGGGKLFWGCINFPSCRQTFAIKA